MRKGDWAVAVVLVVAIAALLFILSGCSGGSPPAPAQTAAPAPSPSPTATPPPAPTSSVQSIATAAPIASATPLGPFIPTGPPPTPNPPPQLQGLIRSGAPDFKWTPPPARAPQSIVTKIDTGGQSGVEMPGYNPPNLYFYARISVACPTTLYPDPSGSSLTTVYAPTVKFGANEFSPDAWTATGPISCIIRVYDFAQRSGTDVGWNTGISIDESDPDFQAKYLRIFPEGHGPQVEVNFTNATVYLTNFLTGQHDAIYTSTDIAPSRPEAWYLAPETHYGAGVPCSPLPDLYVDGVQLFMQYGEDPPGAWVEPATNNYSDGEIITYGDCFTAGGPGAYYRFQTPTAPSLGSVFATSVGP